MDLPDDYLAQTNEKKLTGEWLYEGPSKIWVKVGKDSRRIAHWEGYHLWDDNLDEEANQIAAERWCGRGHELVQITIEKDPVLLAAIIGGGPLANEMPQTTYTLPGETEPFYSRPTVQYPDHIIEVDAVEYHDGEFVKPYPWKLPYVEKEQFLVGYHNALKFYKNYDTSGFTPGQLKVWDEFIKEFDMVLEKYADYIETPWMIPFPHTPSLQEGWDSI